MDREVFEELAFPLALLYEQFGLGLQDIIIQHLLKDDNIDDVREWYESRRAENQNIRDEGIDLLLYLFESADSELQNVVSQSIRESDKLINPIIDQIVGSNQTGTTERLAVNNTLVINDKYYNRLSQTLNTTNATMLDNAENEYRQLLRTVLDDVNNNRLTKNDALKQAIELFSQQGMPAFTDVLGREWTPEAYLNMVIRTETSNAYRESIFAKMEDTLDTELFYISAHRGARPLCEPYQGILCSYNNTRGVAEDINGEKILYIPLNDTSYGELAGIFGINCGHYPIPFIRGISSKMQELSVEEKQNNERHYQESQQQRYIERMIRKWKASEALLTNAGLTEESKNAIDYVKYYQQQMRDFIKETGRTRRPEREQVLSIIKN